MRKVLVLLCSTLLITGSLIAGDEKNTVPASLQSATVYRVGAELVHNAKATLKQGNNELVIEGISNNVDINSIQVKCDDKLTIMSMEFATDFLKPAVKPAVVKRLEDSLEVMDAAMQKVRVILTTDKELLELLKSNKSIAGSQNGLSVAELIKMMEYYKTKVLELQNEISTYQEKEAKLTEARNKIQRQINEEESKNNKTVGKLTLQLLSPLPDTYSFTVSYITRNAFWNPVYDLKVESISKPVKLLYKAKLVQTTGIDWKQVKLTLATSTPNQNGNAPVMNSWFLGYVDPYSRQRSLAGRVPGIAANTLNESVVVGYGTAKKEKQLDQVMIRGNDFVKAASPLYVLNGDVISQEQYQQIDQRSIKNIEILKDDKATSIYGASASNGAIVITLKDDLGDYVTINDNQMDVTFNIDLPYDVQGNGKEQSLALKKFQVNTLFKYYAVPSLAKDAFLLGNVADWESLNLLPGEANIIFEGTYIGKSYIDPNSIQDTMNLTLGKDKRIVVKKDKLKDFSSVKFLGNSKKQIMTYEITVKNNKKEPIQLLLKDQYPLSTSKDIEVELLESSDASINTDLGILAWKLDMTPGEQKKVRISYSVKYPKDKTINL
jgi:TonB-dependent SusC/RagA subfamily outer membrane receptor